MNKKRIMSFVCVAFFTFTVMLAKDIQKVVFDVPQMHCQNCEKKVKENMRFEKGVKDIAVDLTEKTVTITYDADKTTVNNLISGFKKIKYNVTLSNSNKKADTDKNKTE